MPRRAAIQTIREAVARHQKYWPELAKPDGFELPKELFEKPRRKPKDKETGGATDLVKKSSA
jgi:hypothetical protein